MGFPPVSFGVTLRGSGFSKGLGFRVLRVYYLIQSCLFFLPSAVMGAA